MTTIWRFLKVFTLGTWLGGMIFFGFVAGVLFSQLKSIDEAGNIVGILLWGLHIFGIVAAIVFLIVSLVAARSWRGLFQPASILVELMLLVTLISQVWIMPTMDHLRAQMGSYMNTPANNPLRLQFDHLHVLSVRLETGVLILGIIALIFAVAQKPPRLSSADVASAVPVESPSIK